MATRKRNNKKQGNPRRQQAIQISHPPQLNGYQITHDMTMRFVTTSAIAQDITYQNLLDVWNVATAAAVAYDLFHAVKVRRLRLWSLPVLGNAATVTASFDGAVVGAVGDQVVHTDTSMGIEPAMVDCKPAVRSSAALFQPSSADGAFNLLCPAGTVVDVALTFKQSFEAAPLATQNPPAAATVGFVYLRGLDGQAVATSKFTVVGGVAD
jgi:hypothetical protein